MKSTLVSMDNPSQGYILVACYVVQDGIGDLGHFIDIFNALKTSHLLQPYQLLGLVIDQIGTRLGSMETLLRESSIDLKEDHIFLVTENMFYPSTLKMLVGQNLQPRSNFFQSIKHKLFPGYIDTNPALKAALLQVKGMINVSSDLLDIYRNQSHNFPRNTYILRELREIFSQLNHPIPCVSILEHELESETNNSQPHLCYTMGVGPGTCGIMLKQVSKSSAPAESLLHFENRKFLSLLLNKDISNLKDEQIKQEGEQFLKKSLLIPGHFQEGSTKFMTFVHAVASSELASSYDEIVFVVSKDNVPGIEFPYSDLSNHIKQLTCQTAETNNPSVLFQIEGQDKDTSGLKNVRIFAGFWLSTKDLGILHECAQIFGGCSGDKSTEKVISYGLIPLLQPRNWKHLEIPLANYASAILESQGVANENNVVAEYFNVLNKLSGAFYDHNQYSKYMDIAVLLNDELKKQWDVVLQSLRQNRNFYDELPKIMQEMLSLVRRYEQNPPSQKSGPKL